MQMMVSVVIPVYNGEKYIRKCVESIIMQTYSSTEILLIDDGSTDNTKKEIEDYILNGKIRYYYQENSGAPAARNKGIDYALGQYIIFFDADDIMDANMIESMVKVMETSHADLVMGSFDMIDENGRVQGNSNSRFDQDSVWKQEELKEKIGCISPFPGNKLFVLSNIKHNNIRFANVKIGQDLNFFLKYLLSVESVAVLAQEVCYYRLTPNSISRSYDYRMTDIVNCIHDVEKYYEERKMLSSYEKMIATIKVQHYLEQLRKLCYVPSFVERRCIAQVLFGDCKDILFRKNAINSAKLQRKARVRYILRLFVYYIPLMRYYNEIKGWLKEKDN